MDEHVGSPTKAGDYSSSAPSAGSSAASTFESRFMLMAWISAMRCLGERPFREGFRYAKCGVMITELLPENVQRPALWSELDRERRERVWKTVDRLNATLGRGTVRILSAGPKDAAWKLRAEYRSPRWTTR